MFWHVALQSLLQRRASAVLTISALTLSIVVLLGVEHLRHTARAGFARTVAGVDLIVGARTGDINLLLYSVFRLGNASNNIRWQSYQEIVGAADVAWSIPLSLGDSHRGYRVLGTSADYFRHYQYGANQPLTFAQGQPFVSASDVVLGAEVARRLRYQMGDELVLAHGTGSTSFIHHEAFPFSVVGILAPTGTPVDQTLHISLAGMEAIHLEDRKMDPDQLQPNSITAFMLGLTSRIKVFQVQRQINQYTGEPLQAILPGVTLTQLWSSLGVMENTLRVISALVLVAALFGMAAMLLASLRERRREIVVLRTLGARPRFIALLLLSEALLMTTVALLLALGVCALTLRWGSDYVADHFGLRIIPNLLHIKTLLLVAWIYAGTIGTGLIPAFSAYRLSSLTGSHG